MSEKDINEKNIIEWLHLLCRKFMDLTEGALTISFNQALYILGSNIVSDTTRNEFEISEKIKKKLARCLNEKEAAHFSELHRKLKCNNMINDKYSILYFLYKMAFFKKRRLFLKTPDAVNIHSSTPQSSEIFQMSNLNISSINRYDTIKAGIESSCGSFSIPYITFCGQMSNNNPLQNKEGFKSKNVVKKCIPKKKLTSDLSENYIIDGVLFTMLGIDSKFIKFNELSKSFEVYKQNNMSKSLVKLINRLCECGVLFRKIREYSEAFISDPKCGLVNQSFCASLQHQLADYYRLIAVLQSEIRYENDCDILISSSNDNMTLRRLLVWLMQPSLKLTVFASLVDSCKGKMGGELVSTIYSSMKHGNHFVKLLVKDMLSVAVQPIFSFITQWIFEGELDDNYYEFFVVSDPLVRDDRLWHDKFSLRYNMVPSFITYDQAKKILLTGKAINFLRHICGDQILIKERDVVQISCIDQVDSLFNQEQNNSFSYMIDVVYKETSLYLLEVLNDKYKLFDHLKAMRNYLLLGQGDFIRHLMDLLEEDLAKPAQTLFLHNLTGILESAIRATNAQYVNADIIKRLDVMLLEVSPGDSGWDVFSLEYHVSGHIRTVFTQDSMITYLKVFNFLWRAKRMEYILSIIWKDQMSYAKLFRSYREFSQILHSCQLIGSEMLHFVQQIQYYINFEVLECSWIDLINKMEEADDLDQVITAHNNFLATIVNRSLLDSQSSHILTQLRTIFDLVLQFKEQQRLIYLKIAEEIGKRKHFDSTLILMTNKKRWGTDEQTEEQEVKRQDDFIKQLVPSTMSKLRILSQSFKKLVEKFLSLMTTFSDGSLRCLIFRLNFSEFYHHQHTHTGRGSKITYPSKPGLCKKIK